MESAIATMRRLICLCACESDVLDNASRYFADVK